MVYLITWNLNGENPFKYNIKRKALIERIEAFDEHLMGQKLESTAFVNSNSDSETISKHLVANILDSNDRLIVTKMSKNSYDGLMTRSDWDWIEIRLQS